MTFGNRYQNNNRYNQYKQNDTFKSITSSNINYQTRHNKKFYKNKPPRRNTNLTIINTDNIINSAFQSIGSFDFRNDQNNNSSYSDNNNYNSLCQDKYTESTSTVSKIELITKSESSEKPQDSDKENESSQLTKSSSPKSFDDEITELFSVDGWVNPYSEENYYDNDLVINSQEILKRWNLKRQSNPEVNLTISNYRQRMSKDGKCEPLSERRFLPGLYEDLDESIRIYRSHEDDIDIKRALPDTVTPTSTDQSNPAQVNLMKKDENTLNERITEIRARFQVTKRASRQALDNCQANLRLEFDHQVQMAQISAGNYYELQQTLNMLNQAYQVSLGNITEDYRSQLEQYENASNSQIRALRELFDSGNYQKGQLDNYATLELYQPSAKRRKYDDNGYRVMLLPEKVIKNIIKEDELYYHFYGFPATK